jgi:hypothetical protein
MSIETWANQTSTQETAREKKRQMRCPHVWTVTPAAKQRCTCTVTALYLQVLQRFYSTSVNQMGGAVDTVLWTALYACCML